MSHELRTPLNAIIGYAEMIAEDPDPEEVQPDARKIVSASRHLLALINDILDLSKIEADRLEMVPSEFTLEPLLDECSTLVSPMLKDGVELATRSDNLHVRSDRGRLKQILLNLLSNAAKFTHDGKIVMEARARDEFVEISVCDSGIGIAESKLDSVFEAFGQADVSTAQDYGGTGLGLPISRRLARLLGGDLRVESEAGHGSTFTVSFKRRASAASG